ncbi:enoyl-CoA hydratase-related protein [Halomarina oriensis]|uniref:Enoyl-CoA hydratase n=1 Tax=Halomarina oriensis TaxID=671145 RepID=A0A6B0GRD1_9EURY|nr:enoyl-CoA hydratase [Halomarina oriensis]
MDIDALSDDDLRLDTRDDGLVVRATIDRPDQRNALNDAVVAGLLDALDAADDADARVFVIRGAGETFCSGGDLSAMPLGQGAQDYRENFSGLARLLKRMEDASVITVAAVEGYCLAGGCGLAAACEFVVADADAQFGTPEVNVGLFPAQAMAPITRAVGEKQALKLMFTGERIDAEEAHRIGLVTTVADQGEFEATLDDTVAAIVKNSPVMLSMGKEAYYAQRDMGYGEALDYLKEVIALLALSEDTEEGIDAFLTDRDPEWRGR